MSFLTRKNVLFYAGVALALASGGVELWLFVHIVSSGEVDSLEAIVACLNGAFVFAATKMLIDAWRAQFISRTEVLDLRGLSDCHSGRLQLVSVHEASNPQPVQEINRQLITQYLKLLERLLNANLGSHHYELSLFCGANEPEIVAYYDSNSNTTPRSHTHRKANKLYYIENKYQVVEILKKPSTRTHYIKDTQSDAEDYSFTSDAQKGKVRSTLIHCVDIKWPAAIVITCDKEKVLANEREFRTAFLSIYFGIATDLYLSLLIANGGAKEGTPA